jgi:TetR/AcrR family transcriptional regulator, cholesterol catabolism regulator
MTDIVEESDETAGQSEAFEAKRIDILRRAAIVFADEGFHETSVSGLAERLGFSKPVLYYYAKNKDDLLFQICLMAHTQLKQAIASATGARLSGLGKLRRFFSTYASIMGSDFGRCFVLVDVRALEPKTRAKELRSRRELEEAVRHMLVEGQQDGSIRACDPALTARALFGAFNGIPRWFHVGGGSDINDVVEMYFDLFMFGIARA